MNDLMGECPSLLDDLVFYPLWRGSQCVDMIGGAVLTNSANPVVSSGVAPNGEAAGDFVSASSMQLSIPDFSGVNMKDSDFSVAAWINPASLVSSAGIVGKANSSANEEWCLYYDSSGKLSMYLHNGSSAASANERVELNLSEWACCFGVYDAQNNIISAHSNNRLDVIKSFSGGCRLGTASLRIGALYSSTIFFNGAIGPTPVWRRLISGGEQFAFYNNGLGLRYPFRR